MCFVKSSPVDISAQIQKPVVERHQADAAATKNSLIDNQPRGYLQNIKTTPLGLIDNANVQKKTLLGD